MILKKVYHSNHNSIGILTKRSHIARHCSRTLIGLLCMFRERRHKPTERRDCGWRSEARVPLLVRGRTASSGRLSGLATCGIWPGQMHCSWMSESPGQAEESRIGVPRCRSPGEASQALRNVRSSAPAMIGARRLVRAAGLQVLLTDRTCGPVASLISIHVFLPLSLRMNPNTVAEAVLRNSPNGMSRQCEILSPSWWQGKRAEIPPKRGGAQRLAFETPG